MQIYISKSFSAALSNVSEEKMKLFNEKVNMLKSKNKTEIIKHSDVVELTQTKNITIYAYNIEASVYIVFAFKDKNSLVLLDEIELKNKNEINSLVYPMIQTGTTE